MRRFSESIGWLGARALKLFRAPRERDAFRAGKEQIARLQAPNVKQITLMQTEAR
jgi:hypothetical protein